MDIVVDDDTETHLLLTRNLVNRIAGCVGTGIKVSQVAPESCLKSLPDLVNLDYLMAEFNHEVKPSG